MGWFSDSKGETQVSSQTYSMAGDDRPEFLKTLQVISRLNGNGRSYNTVLQQAILTGSAIKMRSYANWAGTADLYSLYSLGASQVRSEQSIDPELVLPHLPNPDNKELSITSIDIGLADYSYWAGLYILTNYPTKLDSAWTCSYDATAETIRIDFPDSTYSVFSPESFELNTYYMYVRYSTNAGSTTEPTVVGATTSLTTSDSFPSVTEWTGVSDTYSRVAADCSTSTTTTITYSDDTPSYTRTINIPLSGSYYNFIRKYEKTDYSTADTGRVDVKKEMTLTQEGRVDPVTTTTVSTSVTAGVTITRTVTKTTNVITLDRSYRIDTTNINKADWVDDGYFIYQKNTGNTVLDAMFASNDLVSDVFPVIPIRIEREFIDAPNYNHMLDKTNRACKKALGITYDTLRGQISDSDNIDKINFAYAVFGVPLGTQDNASKRYLYAFFKNKTLGDTSSTGFDNWLAGYNAAVASQASWRTWYSQQKYIQDGDDMVPAPGYGSPEPTWLNLPTLPDYSTNVSSGSIGFNQTIICNGADEVVLSGKAWDDAIAGDVKITAMPDITLSRSLGFETDDETGVTEEIIIVDHVITHVRMFKQIGDYKYTQLDIYGLYHYNGIHDGKSTSTSPQTAIGAAGDSAFLVPIYSSILADIPLLQATQMCQQCSYIVINCYQETYSKWWASDWFKVVLYIVAIVISICSYGSASGAAWSFVAALQYALVSLVIMTIIVQIVTWIAIKLFGEEVGAIVGAVVGMIVGSMASAMASGMSASVAFASLMSAQNLMYLTMSIGDGYAAYIGASTKTFIEKATEELNEYGAALEKVRTQYDATFSNVLDTVVLSDSTRHSSDEFADSFLTRTLLTGSDIAETSLSMIANFVTITLSDELSLYSDAG